MYFLTTCPDDVLFCCIGDPLTPSPDTPLPPLPLLLLLPLDRVPISGSGDEVDAVDGTIIVIAGEMDEDDVEEEEEEEHPCCVIVTSPLGSCEADEEEDEEEDEDVDKANGWSCWHDIEYGLA